jgi:hypothetical protein
VRRALCPVFVFCALGLVFCDSEGFGSRFHVLRPRFRFRRFRGRRVSFSCFAFAYSFSAVPRASGPIFMYLLPDTFSAVLRALGPVFLFCGPVLVFGGTEGVSYYFHVLRTRTRFHFWRWVPFSCFALSESFSAVPRASSSVFMFCVPALIFDSTKGVGSRFHVLRSRTRFSGIEGVGSRFNVLRSRTSFRRYRRRPLPF